MARKKKATGIQTFTASGKAVNGTSRAGVLPSPIGSFDPETGRVYQKPRAVLDEIRGRSVVIINKAASPVLRRRRDKSLGMGGVGANRPKE
jgi:hypothetical protein